MVVRVDVLAVQAAREIHVRHEHLAGVNLVPLAGIRAGATAATVIDGSLVPASACVLRVQSAAFVRIVRIERIDLQSNLANF
jgi:hypothetical protein